MNTRDYIILALAILLIAAGLFIANRQMVIDRQQATLSIKTKDYEQLERNCKQEEELVDRLLQQSIKPKWREE